MSAVGAQEGPTERIDDGFNERVERMDPLQIVGLRDIFFAAHKRTGQGLDLKYNPPPAQPDHRLCGNHDEETVDGREGADDEMTEALLPYYEEKKLQRRVDGVGQNGNANSALFNVLGMNG